MGDEAQKNPKTVFWVTFCVSFLALLIGSLELCRALDRWLFDGHRVVGQYAPALNMLITFTSYVSAELMCRVMGVSRARQEVVVIWRNAEVTHDIRPPLVVLKPLMSKDWLGLAALTSGIGVVAFLLVTFLPSEPGTAIYGYLLAAAVGVAACGCWVGYVRDPGFVGSIDTQGVTGYDGVSRARMSVAWEQVGCCEVSVVRTTFGREYYPQFEFKGHDGQSILLMKTVLSGEQTTPFKNAVAHYLAAH